MNDFFWYSKIYFIYLSIRSIWAFINRASIRHFGCQAYRSFACPSSANTRSRMYRNFGYKQERKSVITFVNYSLSPRHTNAFLFENPNILLCFNVPSTRKRWKRWKFWKCSPEWKDLKTQQYRIHWKRKLLVTWSLFQSTIKDGRHQSRTQSLLTSFSACSTKTKGSGKDRFLGDPDWSSEM